MPENGRWDLIHRLKVKTRFLSNKIRKASKKKSKKLLRDFTLPPRSK
jgi:hypothetical protein